MRQIRFLTRRSEHGMTLVELVVVIAIMGVLLVMAVAYLFRARLAGNEAAALGALRTINTAQFAYAVECGNGHYATSLTVLGSKPNGIATAFLNEDLGSQVSPTRSGYTIVLAPGDGNMPGGPDCSGRETLMKYYATAVPAQGSTSGGRAFATNQGGAIYELTGTTPPKEPFAPPARLAK